MPFLNFAYETLNLDCRALNRDGRTVALLSPQGHVDWLLPSTEHAGPLLHSLDVEPHLARTRGLKLALHFPDLAERITALRAETRDGGATAVITTESRSPDGAWQGRHAAALCVNPQTGRYEWNLDVALTRTGREPGRPEWLEALNVYPGDAGRGLFFAAQKRFTCTVVTDADGVVWRFPHQHSLHYGNKLAALRFAVGTCGGYVEEDLNPVVTVLAATLAPDWRICDMFFDLHGGARVAEPIAPGTTLRWRYRIHYLGRAEAAALFGRARPIPVTPGDYRAYHWPRLTLGRNDFSRPAVIDDVETALAFPPCPPDQIWERHGGPDGRGALRLLRAQPGQTIWSARPPAHVPPGSSLRLSGLVKTRNVCGTGAYLRLRPHAFRWRPERHFAWFPPLESSAVTGTCDWTPIRTPPLQVRPDQHDLMAWIDVVLDGTGESWLADMDVDWIS